MARPAADGPRGRPLFLFPCNGNAIEALDCLGDAWQLIGFIDDTLQKQGQLVHGHRVFSREAFAERPDALVLAVPGSPTSFRTRDRTIDSLGLPTDRFATIVHPAARVLPLARIGRNVLIMAGTVVTSNAVVGDHVCILPNTVVHHDAVIGDWTLIGANVTLAGHVQVGRRCYIGSGTSVMNGITIGDGALVGLGSNVIRPIDAHRTVAGNPTRVLR
jgi:sugar O-acyltransferase (sialic acid O-acetyltransferase NeuD family)